MKIKEKQTGVIIQSSTMTHNTESAVYVDSEIRVDDGMGGSTQLMLFDEDWEEIEGTTNESIDKWNKEISRIKKENVDILFGAAYEILYDRVHGNDNCAKPKQEAQAVGAYATIIKAYGTEKEAEEYVGHDLMLYLKERVINCIHNYCIKNTL